MSDVCMLSLKMFKLKARTLDYTELVRKRKQKKKTL